MKITIDTKEDTHEDIKKVIYLLHNLIGSSSGGDIYSNSGSASPPVDTTNVMSMFGDAPAPNTGASNSAPNFNSFLNLVEQKKEASKKYLDEPKVELY